MKVSDACFEELCAVAKKHGATDVFTSCATLIGDGEVEVEMIVFTNVGDHLTNHRAQCSLEAFSFQPERYSKRL